LVASQHNELSFRVVCEPIKARDANASVSTVSFNMQWGMLQRTVFINKVRMLQRTNATTNGFYQQGQDAAMNECYNEEFLSPKSGRCNERMLQQTVFINKVMMLQRTNATTNGLYQ
jgi:hypothetical protein